MAFGGGSFWQNKQLANGIQMPAVGLATYNAKSSDGIYNAIDVALGAGYRLFDTAPVYANEVALNKAFSELLPKYNLRRDEVFISSKLSCNEMGSKDKVIRACNRTLHHLGLQYLDLYLMHCPADPKKTNDKHKTHRVRHDTWSALVKLYESGRVTAIGVSNFGIDDIEDILENKHGVQPVVNQLELHPHSHDFELVNYCQNYAIVVQTCHPFGGSNSNLELLQHPEVIAIARDVGATPAQVLLVWVLQKNVAVAANTVVSEEIVRNMNAHFTLSQEQTKVLDTLDKQKKFVWNPVVVS